MSMVLSGTAAVFGNIFILTVLLLNKQLQSNTLVLTLSFSLSDLAIGLLIIPFGVYNSVSSTVYPSKSDLCQWSGFILLLLQSSSIQSLTWVTVDRFMEICFALNYSNIWTTRRSSFLLALMWLFCILIASLPIMGFGSYAYSKTRFLCCPEFIPQNKHFVMVWMVTTIMMPIFTMCSVHGYMIYVARKQARRGMFVSTERHCVNVPAKIYLKGSMVMITNSYLMICWLPYIAVCVYETLSGQQSSAASSALSICLVLSSAALNPWVIYMTHRRYRSAVRQSLGKLH
uniref:Adenosine receptor A3-like n=1 Tax=Poecilia reticulata TaxID=8081 RepID=A0A3P9NAB2_POERE